MDKGEVLEKLDAKSNKVLESVFVDEIELIMLVNSEEFSEWVMLDSGEDELAPGLSSLETEERLLLIVLVWTEVNVEELVIEFVDETAKLLDTLKPDVTELKK